MLDDIEIKISKENLNMREIAPGVIIMDLNPASSNIFEKIEEIHKIIIKRLKGGI